MSEQERYTDYFGFDLGDGESAIAWMRPGRRTEPQMIELRGRKSIISAIGRHPEKGMLIGEEACRASGMEWLETRFKSRYLADPNGAGHLIEQFARAVLETLRADGRLDNPETAFFFIGCPSGWKPAVRAAYKERFVAAGMIHCAMVSESRAAFMFARESGELRVSEDLLTQPALIVDAGSSTTDFTYVVDLNEQNVDACDFGEVSLGGGILDKMILDRCLEKSPQADELRELLARYPAYAARCELEARRIKELYFTQQARGDGMPCESALKLYVGRTPITLDFELTEPEMRSLLNRPLPELGGRSFAGAYRRALENARDALRSKPPEIILLTGGASRMGLIEAACRAVFPEAQVLKGLEPEYAIARGLCHALRVDQRIQGFSAAVRALIESDEMEKLVLSRMDTMYEKIASWLADYLIDWLAPEVFLLWREGALKTINDISDEVARRTREALEGEELRKEFEPTVNEWFGRMRPEIERLTDPICDEFDLPRASLRFQETMRIGPADIRLDTGHLLPTSELKALVDVTVGAIAACVLGGSGMAVLAAGLPGLIAGFAVGILAGVVGTEAAERLIRKAELPTSVRRLFGERLFRKSIRSRRDSIRAAIYAQLVRELNPPSEMAWTTVRTVAEAIEEQLDKMKERASLMIH